MNRPPFRHLAWTAIALLGACAVSPEEDPVQIRLNDLDARLRRMEAVVANQSLLSLAQQLDALQTELRTLRGRIDELQNTSETLRKQQRDLYTDLDRRLATLEGGGRLSGAAASGAAGEAEQAAYTRAFEALKASDYQEAVGGFRRFLTEYPSSELAPNAAYWLGEAYYVTRDYANAAGAFERVARDWPASQKAPDALLKLGYAQAELRRTEAARATLGEVVARFPETDAARLARERLRKLSPGN